MKKWIILASLWVLIILSLIIFKHTYKGEIIVAVTDLPKKITNEQIQNSGPEVGDEITRSESPQQVVERYLQAVNSALYEEASGLIEPNHLMDYISKQKNMKSQEALKQFVTLYPKGTAKDFSVSPASIQGAEAKVKARINFIDGRHLNMTFYLFLNDDDAHSKDTFWLIVEQEHVD